MNNIIHNEGSCIKVSLVYSSSVIFLSLVGANICDTTKGLGAGSNGGSEGGREGWVANEGKCGGRTLIFLTLPKSR